MNTKILSLSFSLVIASCINGTTQSFQILLNKQEEAIYKAELKKAEKDWHNGDRAKAKAWKDFDKTEIGKAWDKKRKDCMNCEELELDCKTTCNAYRIASQGYIETNEYKNIIVPAYEEQHYHYCKMVYLERILAKENPKNIENEIKMLESTKNYDDTINYTKVYHQTTQYFHSLTDKINAAKLADKIENAMSEYR
jgi:hypothetical protein